MSVMSLMSVTKMQARTAAWAGASVGLVGLAVSACLRGPANESAQIAAGLKDAPTAASEVAVTIKDFTFGPADLTVKKGTTIRFTNKDGTQHTVAPDKSTHFAESDIMTTGKSVTLKFDQAGTIEYKCGIHPNMKGTIKVED